MCFWLTRSAVPAMVAASAEASPASGWTVVASVVTRAGPTMKTTSSTTDSNAKAVRRSPLSSTRCDQRERTDEPIWGSPAPATAANRCGHGAGRPASTEAIIPTSPREKRPAASGSTRLCPNRSMSRAWRTANEAFATRKAADTVPAVP